MWEVENDRWFNNEKAEVLNDKGILRTDQINSKPPFKEIARLFSKPVTKSNIGRSYTKEEMDCLTCMPYAYNQDLKSAQGSQSVCFDIFDTFVEELKDIKLFCESQLKIFFEEIDGIDTDLATVGISQAWATKLKHGEHHSLHNHRNSYISGVLYIDCLPNDSIQFSDYPDTGLLFPKKKATEFNAEGVVVNVKEGDLLLFNSAIPHQVPPNGTNKERISLSFDSFPTKLPSLYPPFK